MHAGGHDGAKTVSPNAHRVGAADFHKVDLPIARHSVDGVDEPAGKRGIAEGAEVDIAHAAPPSSSEGSACAESSSAASA